MTTSSLIVCDDHSSRLSAERLESGHTVSHIKVAPALERACSPRGKSPNSDAGTEVPHVRQPKAFTAKLRTQRGILSLAPGLLSLNHLSNQ